MESVPDPALDLALVRAALAGHMAAIDALTVRLQCVPRMLAAQNARLGRPLGAEDLADLAQETTALLLAKLGEFAGKGALEAWAYRFCRLELMNALRRRRRKPPGEPLEDTEPDDAAAREWQRMLAREALEAALDRVGGVEADALRMKHFQGLTFEEMAARTAVSIPAVKARYYRAMKRLEAILRAQDEKEDG